MNYKTGPIPGFLWYKFKDAFESVGLIVKEPVGPGKNIPVLNIVINLFNDDEAQFTVSLTRNGYLLMQKEITVTQKPTMSIDVIELEKRQFELFNLMGAAILNESSFKKAFFSDKGKIE